jgi:Tol biopolymer transport system component
MTVVEVRAAGGAIRPITSQHWWHVGHLAWLRDGSGLIMVAKQQASDPSQVWHLSYSTGEVRRITNDLNNYVGVSLTRDNPPAVVTIRSNVLSSIVVAPDESNVKDIPVSSVDGVVGISWTPEEKIVYTSRLKGDQDIYIMDQDGSNRKQLTADARDNNWPSVSPDGRYIVFMSNRAGANSIWRMDIDGNNPKQLTSGGDARWPRCAPDSRWVVYASIGKPNGLFKISIDGGDPVQLTDKTPRSPAISPDGKLIATDYHEDPEAKKTAIYSSEGRGPLKILNFSNLVCWTPDGRSLTYIDRQGIPNNIVSQPNEGGLPRQLTHFKDGQIVDFDWSRGGKLACSRKVVTADAVIINDLH